MSFQRFQWISGDFDERRFAEFKFDEKTIWRDKFDKK